MRFWAAVFASLGGFILITYFPKRYSGAGWSYQILSFIASISLIIYYLSKQAYQPIVINAFFLILSIPAFYKLFRKLFANN